MPINSSIQDTLYFLLKTFLLFIDNSNYFYPMTNEAIANQFSLLSKLMDIHGENNFKSKSFANAAFNIEKVTANISELNEKSIKQLPGIGVSVTQKILEIISTGEMKQLQEIITSTPDGILEMMMIKGIGPKKINTIWKEMKIENLGELLYACKENRLKLFKGFGEKTQNKIAELIEFYNSNLGNHLFASVEELSKECFQLLQNLFTSNCVEIAGEIKNQSQIVTSIDFVIAVKSEEIKEKLSTEKKLHFIEENKQILTYKTASGISLKLHPVLLENKLDKLFEITASENFKNKLISTYPIGNYTEQETYFKGHNIQIIPAYLWETEIAIDAAANHTIPEPINVADVKGLIHCHSTWSDGSNSIAEMAAASKAMGHEYMLITDHSKAAFYAEGLSELRVQAQHKEIEQLNASLDNFIVYKGIECDILNDGSLDYEEEILSTFDCIIASIHSNLNMTEEKAMKRLIGAITNPYTSVLGHLTGRLLLSRTGYPVNHKELIDCCAAHDVAIELNANPHRLDLDWSNIEYALSKQVLISINPDAHSIKGIGDIRYGVLQAQKAMMKSDQNLSSFDRASFESFMHDQHYKRS